MAGAEPNGRNLTWPLVGAGACGVLVTVVFMAFTFVLNRMDRMFERLAQTERELSHLSGYIEGKEKP